jgi:hypothetical protein
MELLPFVAEAHTDLRTRLFDQVLARVPSERWAEQVGGGGSSLAWIVMHLARHQDLAVSTAVRDRAPLFATHREALGLDDAPIWAGIPEKEDRRVSAAVPPEALVAYTTAVFDATGEWLDVVAPMAFDTIPNTAWRLAELAGLPADDLGWLFSMWGGRTVAWFAQWPVLGHGNNHVGEAIALRNRLGLSPF